MSYLFTKDEQPTMENFNNKLRGAVENAVETADFKVGDTLTTVRTDLGENWLLCNGETINRVEYQELVDKLPNYLLYYVNMGNSACVATDGNGTWAQSFNNGETPNIRIFTNDDMSVYSDGSLPINPCIVADLAYGNGVWVAVGYYGNVGYIFTATNPAGTWSYQRFNRQIASVAYHDGMWVACGFISSSNTKTVYKSTDPTSGWESTDIDTSLNMNFDTRVVYENGMWHIVGSTQTSYPCIVSSADLLTWPETIITAGGKGAACGLSYHDGLYVSVGRTSGGKPLILTSTDITGTWSVNENTFLANYMYIYDVLYFNGEWFAVGFYGSAGYLLKTKNPTAEWDVTIVSYAYGLRDLCASGDLWMAGGATNNNVSFTSNVAAVLPSISQDKTYTYIKAKE